MQRTSLVRKSFFEISENEAKPKSELNEKNFHIKTPGDFPGSFLCAGSCKEVSWPKPGTSRMASRGHPPYSILSSTFFMVEEFKLLSDNIYNKNHNI